MSNFSWKNLRSWNESQQNAFEELCCQLASSESFPNGSFIRKATPDGGVECYWTDSSGDEHAWQAKFFLSPLDTGQWNQIKESFETALEKHPKLKSYTICLPIDRADPRMQNKKWSMDVWNEKVDEWTALAKAKKKEIIFPYWGSFELSQRLTKEVHAGRRMFWFNEIELTTNFLKTNLQAAITAAGERYHPELNVEVPIQEYFDKISRNAEFWQSYNDLIFKIEADYERVNSNKRCLESMDILAKDLEKLKNLGVDIDALFVTEEDKIRFHPSLTNNHQIKEFAKQQPEKSQYDLLSLWKEVKWHTSVPELLSYFKSQKLPFEKMWDDKFDEIIEFVHEGTYGAARKIKSKDINPAPYSSNTEVENARTYLHSLGRSIASLASFFTYYGNKLTDKPIMLLSGPALMGKTHLFCDIASKRIENNQPTLIILGQSIRSYEEPWTQILKILGLKCTRDELLGALNAWAEAIGSRALIMIDALNEGFGKELWHDHLAPLITHISQYNGLGLALSVRTTELAATFDEDQIAKLSVHIDHPGFADVENIALELYCKKFKIALPSVPPIHEAYRTPGLLYLICSSLHSQNQSAFPKGSNGSTWIFETYIQAIHEKLWKPTRLDYSKQENIVSKAVDGLAQEIVDQNNDWLELEKAKGIVNAFLPGRLKSTESLFNALLDEGLIAIDKNYRNTPPKLMCRFSFQKFEQYLIGRKLVDTHLKAHPSSTSFTPESSIGVRFKDEQTARMNSGLLEALSIIVPEKMKVEFADAIPWAKDYSMVREGFIDTLVWRESDSIEKETTLKYLNNHALKYSRDEESLFDSLIALAVLPGHKLNADYFHRIIFQWTLTRRDQAWSIYLHNSYREGAPAERLVRWALNEGHSQHIDIESKRLAGKMLSWFLCSANRFLRDKSTKALVNLFTNNLQVFSRIMKDFEGINDLYILERLVCTGYGAVMRTTSKKMIQEFAHFIFDYFFKDPEAVIPHVLIREYAVGIIEFARSKGCVLSFDISKARPPFKSSWFKVIPKKKDFTFLKAKSNEVDEKKWAGSHLHQSVLGFEDFSRYIIGEHRGTHWSRHSLHKPIRTIKDQELEFLNSLSPSQFDLLKIYRKQLRILRLTKLMHTYLKKEFSNSNKKRLVLKTKKKETSFFRSLNNSQRDEYRELRNYSLQQYPTHSNEFFNLNTIKCLVMQKVLDLGWTVEKFGHFDRNINRYSNAYRTAHKAERIGKKYQWLAFHEILARLSDNFHFFPEYYSGDTRLFEGAWQLRYVRDIDPSCLYVNAEEKEFREFERTLCWWVPLSYDDCSNFDVDDNAWLKTGADFPEINKMIEVQNPDDGSSWLVLDSSKSWIHREKNREKPERDYCRQLWVHLHSFIVKEEDFNIANEWAESADVWQTWHPEPRPISQSFHGELYWSPSLRYSEYAEDSGWKLYTGDKGSNNNPMCDVVETTNQISTSAGDYDCSNEGDQKCLIPNKFLFEQMDLKWHGEAGKYYSKTGELVSMDPSIYQKGSSSLLVKKSFFLDFLKNKKLKIIWTVQGEKNLVVSKKHSYGPDTPSWLEFSGSYTLNGNQVLGKMTARTRIKKSDKKTVVTK